jgi:hypothetical protein
VTSERQVAEEDIVLLLRDTFPWTGDLDDLDDVATLDGTLKLSSERLQLRVT